MNYIGSKFRLSDWIYETVTKTVNKDLTDMIFCDIFAGTGIVGRKFKGHVKQVLSNDCEFYSYVLNKNYIENSKPFENSTSLIDYLNNLPLKNDGFIYKNYCISENSQRQYFSNENGMKIDTIRTKIEEMKNDNSINDNMYYFLLCSLLESADKVANTASVYGAYLKHLKKTAQKDLILSPAEFEITNNENIVYNTDSNKLIKEIAGDILYLDPPYNERQYGANYHLLNTIAEYKEFIPKGKTGLREYNRSTYCKKAEVANSFEELIKNANFKYIFLSYNNEGLMSEQQIRDIMSKYGKYSLSTKEYQRFRADKDSSTRIYKGNTTVEYLHILEK